MGGANIQIVHYFGHDYLEEEKSPQSLEFRIPRGVQHYVIKSVSDLRQVRMNPHLDIILCRLLFTITQSLHV